MSTYPRSVLILVAALGFALSVRPSRAITILDGQYSNFLYNGYPNPQLAQTDTTTGAGAVEVGAGNSSRTWNFAGPSQALSYANTTVSYVSTPSYSVGSEAVTIMFGQRRDGWHMSYAEASGYTEFRVARDSSFRIGGGYSYNARQAGPFPQNNPGGRGFLLSSLVDIGTGWQVARSANLSDNTKFETFFVGVNGGDVFGSQDGIFEGLLLAGHTYRFSYQAYIQAFSEPDLGAIGSGRVFIYVDPLVAASQVPDVAATSGILLLGLASLGIARRIGRPVAH